LVFERYTIIYRVLRIWRGLPPSKGIVPRPPCDKGFLSVTQSLWCHNGHVRATVMSTMLQSQVLTPHTPKIWNQNQTLYSFSSFFSPLSRFMLKWGKCDRFGDTIQQKCKRRMRKIRMNITEDISFFFTLGSAIEVVRDKKQWQR